MPWALIPAVTSCEAPPSAKLIVPCMRTYFSALSMNEWRTIHISERCIAGPPARRISLSRNESVEKHQHVPLRLWSLTAVVGMIFVSVKR